jgi:hypothetical protein
VPRNEYDNVVKLFRRYHRAAALLVIFGLIRAGYTMWSDDRQDGMWWLELAQLAFFGMAGLFVLEPYIRRAIELFDLLRTPR